MNDTIVANRASQRNNGAIYNRILQALPSKVREEVLRVIAPSRVSTHSYNLPRRRSSRIRLFH